MSINGFQERKAWCPVECRHGYDNCSDLNEDRPDVYRTVNYYTKRIEASTKEKVSFIGGKLVAFQMHLIFV